MSCTVKDALKVSRTVSFLSINWSIKPSTGGLLTSVGLEFVCCFGKIFSEKLWFYFRFHQNHWRFYYLFVLWFIGELIFGLCKAWKSSLLRMANVFWYLHCFEFQINQPFPRNLLLIPQIRHHFVLQFLHFVSAFFQFQMFFLKVLSFVSHVPLFEAQLT